MEKPKILVGMSGGVDSSVCAVLLQEMGYEIAGITLRLHDADAPDVDRDAAAVCERLGISHTVLDLRNLFSERVVENFITEYREGRTPNPCVVCNRVIKFGEMLRYAKRNGFGKIATGHYASVRQNADGRFLLCRGKDIGKDQSYVLYSLTQQQLADTVFPLGALSKAEVRRIAERHGLINAGKRDSQDICFVPDGDYAAFIEQTAGEPSAPGDFTDTDGRILGRHNGLIRYTVGQRKGLGIALGKPAFVLRKEPETNRVVLGDEALLFCRRVRVKQTNFIPFDRLETPLRVTAKLRYRHTEQPATLIPAPDGVTVVFDEPQRAPSPGQSAVFYDGGLCLGGGLIAEGIEEKENGYGTED